MGEGNQPWIMVLVWWDLLAKELGDPSCEPGGRLVEVLEQQEITHALVPKSDGDTECTVQGRMVWIAPVGIAWDRSGDIAEALKDGVGQKYDQVGAVSLVAGPSDLGDRIHDFLAPDSRLVPQLDRVLAVVLKRVVSNRLQLKVERVFDLS